MHLRLPRGFGLGMIWLFMAGSAVAADVTAEEVYQRADEAFSRADTNRDKRLSLDEFLVGRDNAPLAKRDFHLCDFNDDQHLSRDEFLTVLSVVEPKFRGPLPDIIFGLVEQIVTALDAACDDWDKDPQREMNARQFLLAIAAQFQRIGIVSTMLHNQELDPDSSGTVTRAEARRFIEIQMGVRGPDGNLLRLSNGQVVNLALFHSGDLSYRGNKLALEEFAERLPKGIDAAAEFAKADVDHNRFVSLDEWAAMGSPAVFDAVEEFRRMDTNLDAKVDPQELLTGTPAAQQVLAKHVFPGFDWNKDGVLSLAEFRTTPQANPVLPWHNLLDDKNGDDALSLAEFQFETRSHFPLLRMLYFQRLDANGNKSLETNEWSFHTRTPDAFFTLNEDGTGWKEFYRFETHRACGSPAVSPDGKWIAFDACPSIRPTYTVFVMPIHGGPPTELQTASTPSWKPDGTQLVCYSNRGTPGLYLTEPRTGGPFKHLTKGAGGRWSPDGKQIAFTDAMAIKLYDVDTGTERTLAEADDADYSRIHGKMGWSPDGTKICFMGLRPGQAGLREVTTIDLHAKENRFKVHHTTKQAFNADFAWHPTKPRIVFAMFCPERKLTQLYEFDPTNDAPPKLMDGQDPTRNNTDACWTPDGKRLIVISGDY